jgi:hypothetical protein
MNGLSNTELPTKLPLLGVQMSVYMLREFTLAHVELSYLSQVFTTEPEHIKVN